MKEAKALLVTTLVARRAAQWTHEIITTSAINNGDVSDKSMERFSQEIQDALAILTEDDSAPNEANQQFAQQEEK